MQMKQIEQIYHEQVENELALVPNYKQLPLNKEKIEHRVLSFLLILGNLIQVASDKIDVDHDRVLGTYVKGLDTLLTIGLDLHVDDISSYTEIPDEQSVTSQSLKVYGSATKIIHSYRFDDYQDTINDYLTLGFLLGLDFDEILDKYRDFF